MGELVRLIVEMLLLRVMIPGRRFDILKEENPGLVKFLTVLLILPFGLWLLLLFGVVKYLTDDKLRSGLRPQDVTLMAWIGLGPAALALLTRLLLHLLWRPEEPESGPNARWYCPICRRRNDPGNTTCAHCGEGFRPLGR